MTGAVHPGTHHRGASDLTGGDVLAPGVPGVALGVKPGAGIRPTRTGVGHRADAGLVVAVLLRRRTGRGFQGDGANTDLGPFRIDSRDTIGGDAGDGSDRRWAPARDAAGLGAAAFFLPSWAAAGAAAAAWSWGHGGRRGGRRWRWWWAPAWWSARRWSWWPCCAARSAPRSAPPRCCRPGHDEPVTPKVRVRGRSHKHRGFEVHACGVLLFQCPARWMYRRIITPLS